MRELIIIFTLLFTPLSHAVDIFGIDFFLRDSYVRIIDDERGTSIVLPTDTYFEEPGSTLLNPIQYETLDKVADVVKRYPRELISVTGHTDDVYSQEMRYQLSEQYAKRVADFLVDAGVDPDRIREVTGEGDLWPIAPNDTAERRHLNRRVEITLLREAPGRVRYEEKEDEEEIDIEVEVEDDGTVEVEVKFDEEHEIDLEIGDEEIGKESVSIIVNERRQ